MNSENRLEGRSNVFLGANLESDGTSVPVRIRNISSRGALIETSTIVPVGTRVLLTRGALSAIGRLAWQSGGHSGISFERGIDASGWVKRLGHGEQQRVDGIVAAIRALAEVPANLQRPEADSLPAISANLDALCERLAERPGMSLELGEELAKLDSLAGAVRRLAALKPA